MSDLDSHLSRMMPGEEFEGEDLALPEVRTWLAEAKKELELLGSLIDEERPALRLDGPPLASVRELLSQDQRRATRPLELPIRSVPSTHGEHRIRVQPLRLESGSWVQRLTVRFDGKEFSLHIVTTRDELEAWQMARNLETLVERDR